MLFHRTFFLFSVLFHFLVMLAVLKKPFHCKFIGALLQKQYLCLLAFYRKHARCNECHRCGYKGMGKQDLYQVCEENNSKRLPLVLPSKRVRDGSTVNVLINLVPRSYCVTVTEITTVWPWKVWVQDNILNKTCWGRKCGLVVLIGSLKYFPFFLIGFCADFVWFDDA